MKEIYKKTLRCYRENLRITLISRGKDCEEKEEHVIINEQNKEDKKRE